MVESSDSKEILAESLKAEKAKSDKDDYRYNTDNVILNLQYHFSCFFRSIKAITFCIILSLIGVKLTHNPSAEFIFAKSFNEFWDQNSLYYVLSISVPILEERDANIPAGMSYPLGGDDVDDSDELFETAEEQINKRGPELGLGDFSMFSLFLGIVSLEGNWFLTFICYVAIMIVSFS
uniref:Uncharacterized protein n=1 Tax=Panagrolaimus davidi TaxID=227884 RepID=A0A914QCE6_9BILA